MKKLTSLVTLVLVLAMLTVSASAADFTPSVESKSAPTLSSAVDANNNSVDLTITSIPEATGEISDELAAAKTELAAADLTTLVPNLSTVAPNAKASDLVVRDLFDISTSDGSALTGAVTITIQTTLTGSEKVIVLHQKAAGDWEALEDAKLASDGKLTFTVSSLSPFALVIDSSSSTTSTGTGTTSPQTGESISSTAVIGCTAFLALAGVFMVMARKSSVR
jgi:hypothetical protein